MDQVFLISTVLDPFQVEPSPLMVTSGGLSLLTAMDLLGWGVCQEYQLMSWLALRQKCLGNSITWSQLSSLMSGGLLSGRGHLASLSVILVDGLRESRTVQARGTSVPCWWLGSGTFWDTWGSCGHSGSLSVLSPFQDVFPFFKDHAHLMTLFSRRPNASLCTVLSHGTEHPVA